MHNATLAFEACGFPEHQTHIENRKTTNMMSNKNAREGPRRCGEQKNNMNACDLWPQKIQQQRASEQQL